MPATQPLAGFETPCTSREAHAQPSDAQEDVVQLNLSAEDRAALERLDATQSEAEPTVTAVNRRLHEQMNTLTQSNRDGLTSAEYRRWLVAEGLERKSWADAMDELEQSNQRDENQNASHARPVETNIGTSTSNDHRPADGNSGASTSTAHRDANINDGASTSNASRPIEASGRPTHPNGEYPTESHHGAPTANDNRGGMRRTVFSANPNLQFPSAIFRPPPTPICITAQGPENGHRRQIIDMRLEYLRRLDEYKLRVLTETIDEVGLRMILENTVRYVDRIVKYVEQREDSGILEKDELAANETLWEQAIEVGSFIKTNVETKLRYLDAGGRPSAALQDRAAHMRRLNAKIEPFGGEWETWPNFKALWTEYYHNCTDLSKLDLMVKLDEFIVPRSEPYQLISSVNRALPEAYDSAWKQLCATYDNHRRQVDDAIENFMMMPRVSNSRTSYLIVQAHINGLPESMLRLQVDASTWDPILMHIIEKKLDSEVKLKWHQKREPKEVARLQPFREFLIREIDSADDSTLPAPVPHEQRYDSNDRQRSNDRRGQQNRQHPHGQSAAQSGRNNGNGHSNGNASHAGPSNASNGNQRQQAANGATNGAPRVKSKVVKQFKCLACSSTEHSIYSCPVFNGSNLEGRKTTARKAGLCFNCLRTKCSADRCTLGACPNQCNEKHNRLLCPKTFAATVNAVQQVNGGQQ